MSVRKEEEDLRGQAGCLNLFCVILGVSVDAGLKETKSWHLFFILFRPHKRLCIHFSLAMLCLDPVDAIKARNCQKGQQDNADYFK